MSSQIFIARYGVREYPLEYFKGPFDMDINLEGVRQANELASFLKDKDIHVILSSPFKRAVHTADIVANELHLPLFIEFGLTEWLTESLVGADNYTPPATSILKKTFKSIDESFKPVLTPTFPESEPELLKRMDAAVKALVSKFKDKNLLLVSHAPCDLALALSLSGGTVQSHKLLPYPLGGVFHFKQTHDAKWEMLLNGSTSHLTGEAKHGIQGWMLPCLETPPPLPKSTPSPKKISPRKESSPVLFAIGSHVILKPPAISLSTSPKKRPGSPIPNKLPESPILKAQSQLSPPPAKKSKVEK